MPLPIDIIVAVRRDYAEGAKPVAAIRAEYEITNNQLYACLDGIAAAATHQLPPLPRRSSGLVGKALRHRRQDNRTAMVRRLWRAAEAQVRDIEVRLMRTELEPAARERDARALAVLVKTLRELTALDPQQPNPKTAAPAEGDADDDAIPRDMDEFRRELARRMDAFVDARLGRGVPGDADAG